MGTQFLNPKKRFRGEENQNLGLENDFWGKGNEFPTPENEKPDKENDFLYPMSKIGVPEIIFLTPKLKIWIREIIFWVRKLPFGPGKSGPVAQKTGNKCETLIFEAEQLILGADARSGVSQNGDGVQI